MSQEDGEPRPRAAPSHSLGARAQPPDAMVVRGEEWRWWPGGGVVVACSPSRGEGEEGGEERKGKGKLAARRGWEREVSERRVGVGLIVAPRQMLSSAGVG